MKTINYTKIRNNIKELSRNHKLILVIKDNAYGFGLLKIAKIAIEENISSFAVKSINEAIILRKKYNDIFILLLGIPPKNATVMRKYNITVSINDMDEYFYFSNNLVNMHVKINLGMNRFGFNSFDYKALKNKYLKGVYFHTPIANNSFNIASLKLIDTTDKDLIYHVGGSNMLKTDLPFFYKRIGYALYKDALGLFGKIIFIRQINKNDSVGYDMAFTATKEARIGIINIGYVNGISRNSLKNYVFINGKKHFLVGYPCMDYCFVYLYQNDSLNDLVEFIGDNISLSEFAINNNLSEYEVFLRVK